MSGIIYKHFPHLKQNSPEGILYSFLKKNYKCGDLLLALSGGPDSLALFHLLLEYKKYAPLSFHAAHINHHLREVSDQEEEALILLCKENHIPLHIHRIDEALIGNIEEKARNIRYDFFQKLFKIHPFEALVLAHHADDVAETTLKRLFEGAHLTSLGGMKAISTLFHLPLWRPLLQCKKKILSDWLQTRNLSPFIDETNFDPTYLRARMRMQLLPELAKQFGKEVTSSLNRISQEAYELTDLLDSIIASHLPIDPLLPVDIYDLPKNPLVIKHFIKTILSSFSVHLSSKHMDTIVHAIQQMSVHKMWVFSRCNLEINRNTLTIKTL